MTWLLGGVLAFGALFGAVLVLALKRAARAAVQTGPTPDEARITTDIEQRIEFAREQDEKDEQEVMHADRNGLLDRLRGLVRGKK